MMMILCSILLLCLTINNNAYSISNSINTNTKRYQLKYIASNSNSINSNSINSNRNQCTSLCMSDDVAVSESGKFEPSAWLNPNTRGGVIVWSFLLILVPIGFYEYFIGQGIEDTKVGAYVGAIFVLLTNLLWASTYVFRVANKDMTYAKQLKDYENAVLQKRLEELADDEINALMEEIEAESTSK